MTHDQVEKLLELTANAVSAIGDLAIETKRHNAAMERMVATIANVDDSELEEFYRTKQPVVESVVTGFAIPPVPGKPKLSLIDNANLRVDALNRDPLPLVKWSVCDDEGTTIGTVHARTLAQAREQVMMAYGLTAGIAGRLS